MLAVLDSGDEADAFLAWSARLEGTWALTDRVIDRLRELGHDIDLWAEVSLETGLGFHDMVMTRFAPTSRKRCAGSNLVDVGHACRIC